jgi:hypothetical protein
MSRGLLNAASKDVPGEGSEQHTVWILAFVAFAAVVALLALCGARKASSAQAKDDADGRKPSVERDPTELETATDRQWQPKPEDADSPNQQVCFPRRCAHAARA